MCCLVCKYFDPIEPNDHKQLREAGRCEANCGKEWTNVTAVRFVREHRKNIDGWCLHRPEPKLKNSGHICAQISVPEYFFNKYWGLERMESDDTLRGWARNVMRDLMAESYEQQRIDQLEKHNTELLRQLAAARKISASRLARLKKQPITPARSDYPRLVASNESQPEKTESAA